MTSEYIPTGAVVPIDEYINDPEIGLSQEELQIFFLLSLKPIAILLLTTNFILSH
jgi:hypothetical protein